MNKNPDGAVCMAWRCSATDEKKTLGPWFDHVKDEIQSTRGFSIDQSGGRFRRGQMSRTQRVSSIK